MLYAEVHGKLGRDGSRAHDRAEDLLTSTAFQLLRYLPFESGVGAVLRRVRAVNADGTVANELPTWLNLDGATHARFTFWPGWGEHGQPDVLTELFAGDESRGTFVIEVKLDAPKSGEATDEAEVTEAPDSDQLRKYWQGLRERAGATARGVVYLTSHAIPPVEQLAASLARERGDWLAWLSWRDVWAALKPCSDLPARDLVAILAAKGLKTFDGFALEPWRATCEPHFWAQPRAASWFDLPPWRAACAPDFWNTKE
jgi:hypothetical protein